MVSKTHNAVNDFATAGGEIYDRLLKARLEPAENGKFVAIDIESENWEVDADDFTATQRLLERVPNARIWLAKVGRAATYHMGGSRRVERAIQR